MTASIFSFIVSAPLMPEILHQFILYCLIEWCKILCNIKINIYGNKKLLEENTLFMANHYEGVDYFVLYSMITTPFSECCYAIAKDDLLGRQYPLEVLSNIIDYVVKLFYEGGYLIPYTRGDKNSGIRVKNRTKEILQNNKKLLVFPEGRSWRKGVCHEFKPGMFEVAEECKKSIIPITLKYRNFDGKNKGEKCVLEDWMDIDVDVFIHDKVNVQSHDKMLSETFEKISSKN
jgi:1-acyl-sn-glycerol-3-phosphate acyltransferase